MKAVKRRGTVSLEYLLVSLIVIGGVTKGMGVVRDSLVGTANEVADQINLVAPGLHSGPQSPSAAPRSLPQTQQPLPTPHQETELIPTL